MVGSGSSGSNLKCISCGFEVRAGHLSFVSVPFLSLKPAAKNSELQGQGTSDPSAMNFGSGGNTDAKAWKDIWGCGQGIGAVKEVLPAAKLVAKLVSEYESAKARLVGNTQAAMAAE